MKCECGYDMQEQFAICPKCGKVQNAAGVEQVTPMQVTSASGPETQKGLYNYKQDVQYTDAQYKKDEVPVDTFASVYADANNPTASPSVCSQTWTEHRFRYLGGFLMVFVVLWIIDLAISLIRSAADLTNISTVLDAATALGPHTYAVFLIVIEIATWVSMVLDIVFIVMLIAKRKHFITVYFAILIFGIISVVFGGLAIGSISGIAGSSQAVAAAQGTMVMALVFGVIINVLMLYYFLHSVRVRTYMQSDAYVTKTIWKFITPVEPAVSDNIPTVKRN